MSYVNGKAAVRLYAHDQGRGHGHEHGHRHRPGSDSTSGEEGNRDGGGYGGGYSNVGGHSNGGGGGGSGALTLGVLPADVTMFRRAERRTPRVTFATAVLSLLVQFGVMVTAPTLGTGTGMETSIATSSTERKRAESHAVGRGHSDPEARRLQHATGALHTALLHSPW